VVRSAQFAGRGSWFVVRGQDDSLSLLGSLGRGSQSGVRGPWFVVRGARAQFAVRGSRFAVPRARGEGSGERCAVRASDDDYGVSGFPNLVEDPMVAQPDSAGFRSISSRARCSGVV
jgi:hypothetical protein